MFPWELFFDFILAVALGLVLACFGWRVAVLMQRVWNCLSYRSACVGFLVGNLLVAGINGWIIWHFRDDGFASLLSVCLWLGFFLASVSTLIAQANEVIKEKKMARIIGLLADFVGSESSQATFLTDDLPLHVGNGIPGISDEEIVHFLRSLITEWGREVRPGVFEIAASKLASAAGLVEERYPGWA